MFTSEGFLLTGSLTGGAHESRDGFAWITTAPHCLARSWIIQPHLTGCGVETIVEDPADPRILFATSFDFSREIEGRYTISPGGVSFADGSGPGRTALWHRSLSGVRGNGLAVSHGDLAGAPTRIVVGRIQATQWDVGFDDNVFCESVARDDGCSPSVYISDDGGHSWGPRYFEGSPCPNGQGAPLTSSRLVSWVGFDPAHPNVIYASANSGLWVSSDAGATWTNPVSRCALSPGVALVAGRVYVGTSEGEILVAEAGPDGPGGFEALTADAPIGGAIQSLMPDARDPSGRTLFVASWAAISGQNSGGVYRIRHAGDHAVVTDLGQDLIDGIHPATDDALRGLRHDMQSLFLAQNPRDPDVIYVTSRGGGLYVRSDGA